jgi:hypothetical protein
MVYRVTWQLLKFFGLEAEGLIPASLKFLVLLIGQSPSTPHALTSPHHLTTSRLSTMFTPQPEPDCVNLTRKDDVADDSSLRQAKD